jgi:ectoine hydroxylase-related dioxygenase (phytanoyl-CoA dioxygenase family)
MTTALQPDIDQLINELHINGFVVFEDLIPVETIDRIYARCKPMMDRIEAWNSTVLKGERSTGQGRVTQKQRFKIYPPFEMPFSDPVITENPLVLELLERVWGTDDIELHSYSSNCPAPGTEYQNWHRDGMLLAPNLALPVYPALGLNFSLVDTNEDNGSTEIVPCTHHCSIEGLHHVPGSETAQSLNEVIEAGRYPSKMRLNLKRGSAWIVDPRIIHRGMPNRSDHTRIMLGVGYTQSWFGGRGDDTLPKLTQGQFDQLSERGKRLLRNCVIVG